MLKLSEISPTVIQWFNLVNTYWRVETGRLWLILTAEYTNELVSYYVTNQTQPRVEKYNLCTKLQIVAEWDYTCKSTDQKAEVGVLLISIFM